ncbi:hypothetical protein Mapa_015383 [Marchantia paleacea]|nr:hypothetical protein Mapa_015383 [Marchantia paleacea]
MRGVTAPHVIYISNLIDWVHQNCRCPVRTTQILTVIRLTPIAKMPSRNCPLLAMTQSDKRPDSILLLHSLPLYTAKAELQMSQAVQLQIENGTSVKDSYSMSSLRYWTNTRYSQEW